ncbi:protein starmaker-like [Mizuhopecten yessoensis]|uniref:protein starmaker-like n=1 Tax=Mizuhopecten yessoensis TaxID=6573 RepID=UPI000B45E9B3|nr:protein starmaker-like [Mizuhopecten yessoensis]
MNDTKVGIFQIYDEEPENILRAKRAMLHCIYQGMDPKEKEFRKQVRELVREKDNIPRHDDVYKFEEDQDNQDSRDGATSSYKEGRDDTDSVPRDSGERHPDTPQTDRGTENTDQEPPGTAETDRGTENTDQESRGTAETDRGTENTDQESRGTAETDRGTENTDQEPRGTAETDRGTENTDQEPRGTAETDRGTENTDQEPRGTAETDRGTENTDQEPRGTAETDRGTENTDQEPRGTAETDRGTENTDQEPRGTAKTDRGTENTDQEPQGIAETDRGTENTDQEPQGTAETDSGTENTDQEPRGTAEDDFRYTIKQRRLAVYIGVGKFEKRLSDGESDGTGIYNDKRDRTSEEKRDRSEAEQVLERLGFTFNKNPTDETTKEKVDKFIEKGIPKLFFIQACRSEFGTKKEDVVDKGVGISVEVQGNSELEKDLAASRSNGHRDISDARPRNLKPKVTTPPQPGTEVADDTKEANTRANVPHVKPPVDTPPEGDKTVNSRDNVKSHNEVSDARPRNQTSGLTNPQSSTLEPIQNAGGAKPLIDIATESEEKQSMDTPEVKDNSVAKKTSDLADVRQPKPNVDTTPQVLPQQDIPSITCIEDGLVMFASAPGKEAYRRLKEGGWMMQSVIKELESWPSHPDQDLLQVLTKVIGKIAIENETDKGYKSAACLTHMLIKDVYLC